MPEFSCLLIADDNERFSQELEDVLKASYPNCEIIRVNDGQQAWMQIQTKPYDLVISEWNLPHLSGGDLLLNVRSHYQTRNLPFVMLTSRVDRISVLYAMRSGVTAYIKKPFDRGLFVERIGQLIGVRREEQRRMEQESGYDTQMSQETRRQRSVDTVIKRLRSGDITLPVLPEIVLRVNEAVLRPNANIQDLTDIIEKDAGVCSKLLALANSGYYRGVRPYKTLREAVIRLGFRQTQNYVLTLTTRGLFELEDPFFGSLLKKMWIHSVATAAAARSIAQHIRTLNQDVLYGKGLMHDIGKLLLLHTMAGMPQSKLDNEAVFSVLDTMHTEYGAALLSHWRFSSDFNDVCLRHHDMGETEAWAPELLAVACANVLVRELGWSLHEEADNDVADHEMAHRLGLREETIADVLHETKEYVNEAILMIWGGLGDEEA